MEQSKLIEEENKKVRRLQLMVDLTIQLLYQTKDLTLPEALEYIRNARTFSLTLFPEKGEVFDLIYTPRFWRILRERGIVEVSQN